MPTSADMMHRLPALTLFRAINVSDYLEDLLSQIEAPLLGRQSSSTLRNPSGFSEAHILTRNTASEY
jgi:hypothetical protein